MGSEMCIRDSSWSVRDFSQMERDGNDRSFTPVDMSRNVPDDDDEPVVAPSPAKSSHFRLPSRSTTLPSKLQPMPSTESLRVGGDVSTRDNIGAVPAPTTRPRAGTHGSLRGGDSQRNSSAFFSGEGGNRSSDMLGDPQYAQPGSQRASRNPMLTPAQEQEEFGFLPRH